jgi:hypothetical protein
MRRRRRLQYAEDAHCVEEVVSTESGGNLRPHEVERPRLGASVSDDDNVGVPVSEQSSLVTPEQETHFFAAALNRWAFQGANMSIGTRTFVYLAPGARSLPLFLPRRSRQIFRLSLLLLLTLWLAVLGFTWNVFAHPS